MVPERVVLHLDMNAFFASVEQQSRPQLRGRPVIVSGNRPACAATHRSSVWAGREASAGRQTRTVVATASYEARAYGVATGMSLREALAWCPQAVVVEGHPAKYADTFGRVARLMARYSPVLEIFSIDEAFLDLTGTAGRFGGPEAVARALHAQVAATLRLSCSIGIGPNKLLAKLASSRKKPNGLTRITPAEVEGVLADLPVQELCGIGSALQRRLNAEGIRTCGELARVPLGVLIRQFGAWGGTQVARMARGVDDRPVVPGACTPPAKSMGHLHTLAHDVDRPVLLRPLLLDVAEQLGRRLRAAGACGRTITVTLRDREFTTWARARTLPRTVDTGEAIFQAAWRLLETMPWRHPVRLVGLSVSGLAYGEHQRCWLPEEVRSEQLTTACDRINDRFGEGSVQRATLIGAPEPARHDRVARLPGALMSRLDRTARLDNPAWVG